ncbi:hypothetical protein C8R45DRAFT_830568, partial [Mycena sanguinolenta]
LRSIAAALSTQSGAEMLEVNKALRTAVIDEWGKVQRVDSDEGDTMWSCSVGTVSEDSRDATFVRVCTAICSQFYSSSERIYSMKCLLTRMLKTRTPDHPQLQDLVIHFYSRLGALDLIDITAVQSLIGRIELGNSEWVIIDRSGSLARAMWAGDQLVQYSARHHITAPHLAVHVIKFRKCYYIIPSSYID